MTLDKEEVLMNFFLNKKNVFILFTAYTGISLQNGEGATQGDLFCPKCLSHCQSFPNKMMNALNNFCNIG